MRILIADDERPARAELRYILEQLEATAVYHEARNGQQALDIIAKEPIDVLFLDINMPGLTGLMVAAAIMERPSTPQRPAPLIVFATAYDAHAVRAFELAAIDYVVKPFSETRIARTMVRIRQILTQREQLAAKQSAMQSYLAGQEGPGEAGKRPFSIPKLWGERENDSSVLVDYKDIFWIEATAKRVFMRTAAGETVRIWYTIKELESRLLSHGFVRIHKGYLVNLDHVAEVAKGFSGTFIVIMKDDEPSKLPMSRQYGKRLRDMLRGG